MANDGTDWTKASVATLLEAMASGEVTASAVAEAFLGQIAVREPEVQAWQYLDPDYVRRQAEALDRWREDGKPLGALHGIPVAMKDIVDVEGMPTEHGTPIFKGNMPSDDAWITSALRAAGAVIMGKAVTTELASMHPGKTRYPHDPARTPGGSSSGSAAAVASHMAPLAIGTQTKGSVIRPAAFCGVVGFKPTFGTIPRTGVLTESQSMDHLGVFASDVDATARLADQLFGHDVQDRDTRPMPLPQLAETTRQEPPMTPRFAFVGTARWSDAERDVVAGFDQIRERLGPACEAVELSSDYDYVWELHDTIIRAEMAQNYGPLEERGADLLSAAMRAIIAEGRNTRAVDYANAFRERERLVKRLDEIFASFDVILTPTARGEAPLGLETTGDPVFCAPWTYFGVPAVSLPLLEGSNGLPIGVQLVGAPHNDALLLRTAQWLMREMGRA